jgi:hypothetical protein
MKAFYFISVICGLLFIMGFLLLSKLEEKDKIINELKNIINKYEQTTEK